MLGMPSWAFGELGEVWRVLSMANVGIANDGEESSEVWVGTMAD